ncbi:PhoX family protein [Cellvibrio sp. ARAG 10.3]|uniref:PhoX family protein n=1 Tax=Cellvibrio sp. ARAG 10.3 TaxID=3451358 RepID=UPI003F466375
MTEKNTPLVIDNSGDEPLSNFSDNPTFAAILDARQQRRAFLKGGVGAAVATFMGIGLVGCGSDDDDDNNASSSSSSSSSTASSSSSSSSSSAAPLLGFTAIAAARPDTVLVPEGYTATAFVPWGTPLTGSLPEYKDDGTNTGADQEQQVGAHHDGIFFLPMDAKAGGTNSNEGLLVMNHEYFDPNVFHANGPTSIDGKRPTDEVRKEVAGHGVSVIHIRKTDNAWGVVEGSVFNRRITGATPMDIRGPAMASAKLSTKYSPNGTETRGTLNNCGSGLTPWHTYLAAEENWAGYFVNKDSIQPREHERYGVPDDHSRFYWETAESGEDLYARFDASTLGATAADDYRNEPNTFGWMVEIDPFDPESKPQKRTALGRFGHEGVIFAPAEEGKPIVCYSGDDSTNEYIYKYVSADNYYAAIAGGYLLNNGTLYVAKFNEDGTGDWLPLDINNPDFIAKAAEAEVTFADQADVLINTRLAADVMGATKMDRPEWGAVHPDTGEVYFTLTNNSGRTVTDAANPRAENRTGHIIRWRENADANTFEWDIFLLGGDVGTATGDISLTADNHFASPDGLWIDPRGVLWIQTDMSGSQQGDGPFGNNQMLAADPVTKETKRFLVGPMDCEVTGVHATPDLKTLFVNIQHPGDRSAVGDFTSHWPGGGSSRPRSATVIVTKNDGGMIGS